MRQRLHSADARAGVVGDLVELVDLAVGLHEGRGHRHAHADRGLRDLGDSVRRGVERPLESLQTVLVDLKAELYEKTFKYVCHKSL